MKPLLILAAVLMMAIPANAGFVFTEQTSTNVDTDGVGYSFKIEQDDTFANLYTATLTNTSPSQTPDVLIDALLFGVDPDAVIGTDIFFDNASPDWSFSAVSGGIQFDYLGLRDDPSTRLGIGDSLTFDITFDVGYWTAYSGTDGFDMFLNEPAFRGTGVGGGETVGQVAVSFQQLGPSGQDSELLASNWGPVIDSTPVPEPSAAAMFALGIAGLGLVRRRKR